MKVIIAQGEGYYGLGFFTIDLSIEKLKMALNDEPDMRLHSDDQAKEIVITYRPDTVVSIHDWDGQPQPNPVILFDSGHSAIDMHVLKYLHQLLHSPYVTNGEMEKRVAEKQARADVAK